MNLVDFVLMYEVVNDIFLVDVTEINHVSDSEMQKPRSLHN